jgi:RimJ/RimL family protein N-acetyltransferase
MIEIWSKDLIFKLTDDEKNQWFDVLNFKLEEDRNISPLDPDFEKKQREIRDDYFRYINQCSTDETFYKYYFLKNDALIISVCRINIYDNKYILEGLQTHKDYYHMGYAFELLNGIICDLKNDGIEYLYSEARKWNVASNNLQQKIGFKKYGEDTINNLYIINTFTYGIG